MTEIDFRPNNWVMRRARALAPVAGERMWTEEGWGSKAPSNSVVLNNTLQPMAHTISKVHFRAGRVAP